LDAIGHGKNIVHLNLMNFGVFQMIDLEAYLDRVTKGKVGYDSANV